MEKTIICYTAYDEKGRPFRIQVDGDSGLPVALETGAVIPARRDPYNHAHTHEDLSLTETWSAWIEPTYPLQSLSMKSLDREKIEVEIEYSTPTGPQSYTNTLHRRGDTFLTEVSSLRYRYRKMGTKDGGLYVFGEGYIP